MWSVLSVLSILSFDLGRLVDFSIFDLKKQKHNNSTGKRHTFSCVKSNNWTSALPNSTTMQGWVLYS